MIYPRHLEPVVALIQYQSELGTSEFYEVVYYDIQIQKWESYFGSSTFEGGEQVLDWYYPDTKSKQKEI